MNRPMFKFYPDEGGLLGGSGGEGASGGQASSGGTGDSSNDKEGAGSSSSGGDNSNSNNSSGTSWRDALPDDLKGEESLKLLQDVPTLARSYINAQKMVGAEKMAVPNKYTTPEQWQEIYKKLGLPESVDKYELTSKAESELDKDFFDGYKKAAHAAGILPSQAQKIMEWFDEVSVKRGEEVQVQLKQNEQAQITKLKEEWGMAFDKNLNAANATLKKFGGPEVDNFLKDSGLQNNTIMIKFLAKIGENLVEDAFRGEGSNGSNALTPAQAKSEISKVMGNPSHPYFDKAHPMHKQAVDEMVSWNQMLYPEKKKES